MDLSLLLSNYETYEIHNEFIRNSQKSNDSSDLSCLSNSSKYEFNGRKYPKESSIRIFSNSFQLDKTYQLMVQMNNRRNSTIYASAFVLIQIKDFQKRMIIIG